MKITNLNALEVLDSRGKPTVRTFIYLEDGSVHSASVPSGASTGSHEALELRDGDTSRHLGQGVQKAVDHINIDIKHIVVGKDGGDPKSIDKLMLELDGTPNKEKFGANAILAVSLAANRAAAHSNKQPLWQFINQYYQKTEPSFPRLMVNVVNGGKHAGWNFDIQEFMVVPSSNKPSESTRVAAEIFQLLGKVLKEKKLFTLVGDEGGYSPALTSNNEVLETIITAASQNQYTNGKEYDFALDAAATEFFAEGSYILKKTNQKLSGDELINVYHEMQKKYGVISFEDPFAEDDWETFKKFTSDSEDRYAVVGDDLFVTNPIRIQKGIEQKAANAVLIKLNQIGSVSETMSAINLTQKAGWKVIISHRSGETEDTFIADLAYGVGADFIKTGSMSRSERLAKYNRLLEIEHNL